MNRLSIVLGLMLILVSCKKESGNNNNQNLQAQTIIDVSYGNDPLQKMDLYLPAGRTDDSTKIMVLVHGGAWAEGDKTEFTTYVADLQQRLPGYAIANINYRLATPSVNHFPTQENDMKSAIDFLVQKRSEYHFSEKIVLLGASAGAHLSLLQAYKYASPKIKGVVDFFGPTDMASMYNTAPNPISQLGIQILMNGTPATNNTLYQQSSPINYVSSQSCPTIILHGGMDNVVAISESVALKTKLQSFGITVEMYTYPNEGHNVWPSPAMTDAFNKIETFIKTNVH